MQVLLFLVGLQGVGMVDVAHIFYMTHNLGLEALGSADFLHTRIQYFTSGLNTIVATCRVADLSHIQPKTLLSLAWPRYLNDLAASKSPITQVSALFIITGH